MFRRVLVTGGTGLVGSALQEISHLYEDYEFYFAQHKDYDLSLEQNVRDLFENFNPHYVIHTAAKTGGVKKESSVPADRYYDNLLMNSYIVHYSYLYNVEKLLAFSSVACYDPSLEFLTEDKLHFGQPHENFKFYGYTKRMMDLQIEAYKKQHNLNYTSLICGNIFGKHDGFNLEHGHVVPSLIHRCFLSKENNVPFKVWGDGSPKREFIFSKDLAKICLKLLSMEGNIPSRIIVSGSQEISIKKLAETISSVFNNKRIEWTQDTSPSNKSRITEKKVLNSLIPELEITDFASAIEETIEWFVNTYPNVRL
jgi:GDP-L-fucose synthase